MSTVSLDELRGLPILSQLSDEQLAALAAVSDVARVGPGEEVFHEGAHAETWWVLLDGSVELSRRIGREEVAVGRMDVPGRWAGGFRAWDAEGVYLATAKGLTSARLLRVPADALRDLTRAWFPLGGHLIEGLFHTARSIESTARQRDSLISLGTLAAGLAHELNNPAAAAVRATRALDEACSALLGSLRDLAGGRATAEQFLALDVLRAELASRSSEGAATATRRDPLELADAEDELVDWMSDHDLAGLGDHPERVAGPLANAGADVDWCDRVAEALAPSPPGPALAWVAGTLEVRTLLAEVHESTGRVSELVAAVRSYSQLDRASRQQVDVTDGLESTLLVLGHKLRGGVDVVRDYGPDVPPIDAYAGELNQVWTNLVDNAIDAMDGEGALTLTTRPQDDGVVVEVTDSGPGMPPEVVARAFEAFFTTKDVGRGTGLGLDIARRIVVERHSGTIDIDTSPDGTTIRVWLPRRASQA